MFCKKCGNELQEGTAFCPKCGCKVSLPISNPAREIQVNVENPIEKVAKRGWIGKRTLAIVIIAAVVILAGTGVAASTKVVSSPEKTVKKMMKASNNADVKGMLKCYSPKTNSQYEGAMGVFGLFGIDGDSIMGLASSFADPPQLKVIAKDTTYYKDGKEMSPEIPDVISNITADKASITVDLYEDGELWDTITFELGNYVKDGWLIEEDLFAF